MGRWTPMATTATHKECRSCHEMVVFAEYTNRTSGLDARCKACRRVEARHRYHTMPHVKRAVLECGFRARYGLELAEFEEMAAGGCEVCGATERLHADHDHSTGEFRGVLCHHCNLTLGNALEDAERLAGLIQYLGAHRAR